MSYSLEEKVELFAVCTRLGILVLQFLTNTLIPDHNAGVFQKPLNDKHPNTPLDVIIESVFGGLTRWDAQYFLHIAQYGYTYENTLAFFPLFPFFVRQVTKFLLYILHHSLGLFIKAESVISEHSILILVSVVLNNYLFVKSSVILYKLSLLVLKNEKLAYISSILFCVNSASIFFSACYSESVYCFLVLSGMLKIEEKHGLVNYIIIGLTGGVRSNGILNVGFLLYKFLKLQCVVGKIPFIYSIIFSLGIILSVLPFLAYQAYCYVKFCLVNTDIPPGHVYSYGLENEFVFPGNNSIWCNHSIPFAYSFVQKHYWSVGFLNYYEVKQIPNFLLAAPMIYIMIRGTLSFVGHYKHLLLYLGFVNGDTGDQLPISAFPYVVHGFALTIFSILMIHIQVATRLLASSSPVPYWYCSRIIALSLKDSTESDVLKKLRRKGNHFHENSVNKKSKWKTFLITESFNGYALFIKWYFLIYTFCGTLMFSNYLPWT